VKSESRQTTQTDNAGIIMSYAINYPCEKRKENPSGVIHYSGDIT
jgi:hypothetical protein